MAAHLRKFVTSPLPMFEFEFATETRAPPPLAAAAKCLAQCIKVSVAREINGIRRNHCLALPRRRLHAL